MSRETTIAIPTIHLNGTSGDELQAQYSHAHDSLATALRQVREAAPNARDYYVQSSDAWRQTYAEHEARVKALTTVLDELATINEAIYAARAARRERGAR
jgi:hypothetical protein